MGGLCAVGVILGTGGVGNFGVGGRKYATSYNSLPIISWGWNCTGKPTPLSPFDSVELQNNIALILLDIFLGFGF
jgi:hypothetical protein